MDRGAWRTTVHGVTKSQSQIELSWHHPKIQTHNWKTQSGLSPVSPHVRNSPQNIPDDRMEPARASIVPGELQFILGSSLES